MKETKEKIQPYFIDIKEAVLITGLSKATITRLAAAGKFPKRRRLSPGRIAWPKKEVEDWCKRAGALK